MKVSKTTDVKSIKDLEKHMDLHYKQVKKEVLDEIKKGDIFDYNFVNIKINVKKVGDEKDDHREEYLNFINERERV